MNVSSIASRARRTAHSASVFIAILCASLFLITGCSSSTLTGPDVEPAEEINVTMYGDPPENDPGSPSNGNLEPVRKHNMSCEDLDVPDCDM